jgi:inner membrane protein
MQTGSGPLGISSTSYLVRALIVLLLVVVVQLPIMMINGLIRERQTRRDTAVQEVGSKWGQTQSLTGPMLVVPYTHRWTEVSSDKVIERQDTRLATFLPERVAFRGKLEAETRRRGIFSVPVYRARLDVDGAFAKPSFAAWDVAAADVQWDRAQVIFGVSDIRALESPAAIQWGSTSVELLPGPGESGVLTSGVHSDVDIDPAAAEIAFKLPLGLKGSEGAYWAPVGKTTNVSLESNWGSPSFQGNWLPDQHQVGKDGFKADWTVSYLGRNYPQAWKGGAVAPEVLQQSRFGVDLIQTVDHYSMASRSVKYAGLFLLLTFATLWLVEVLCAVRVHPIQYLLIGAAMCVFYLLELALSEHIGFAPAYAVATVAIVAQITAYSVSVLGTRRRAAVVGGLVTALYGYLYIVLLNEDYALLIGAIGVFALLALIMMLTRRVDWFAAGPARPPLMREENRREAA